MLIGVVEGIVLHVDECGEQPAEVLSYSKSASRTISVGRKSSSGRVVPEDAGRALFRCPVVYLIDLHSHHGTYLLRSGELASTLLQPEVPTVLADGDLITFGKSVGRDLYLVRPIVARVQLIFGRDVSPRAPSPLPKSLTTDVPSRPDKVARSTSGRYGVFPPSPVYSPAVSDGEPDVQEISPPYPPSHPAPSLENRAPISTSASSQSGRLRLLQSFLPPIHWNSHQGSENHDDSFLEGGQAVSPAELDEEDMDLSSSRSASPAEEGRDADVTYTAPHDEPPVIGAWPRTPGDASESSDDSAEHDAVRTPERVGMPCSGVVPSEVIEISDDEYGTPFVPARSASALDFVVEDVEEFVQGNAGIDLPDFGSMKETAFPQVEHVIETSSRLHELTNGVDVRELEACIPEETTEILTKARLNSLDGQMIDTRDRLSVRDDQLSNIQIRLDGLGSLVTDLQERRTFVEHEATRVDDLLRDINVAKEMLREACDLQKEVRMQMAAELEAIKALRVEATAAVAEAKAVASAVAVDAEATKSLKRKRDDMDGAISSDAAVPDSRAIARQPSKRRRTAFIVATVVHTAAAASMGAVAAWAALAFS
ncbi:hypothetical protein BN946_scf185009.g11 [Trametes cinnabarina]|uniref:FHA domain-containing protein n=1 Tax=Pycnoporus cinnabarinus TaxID=5643 RepID=A0A060S712_PYCCI|nr:hypothetical protein BN946_scf185009.g11 [Trametes cinnabarina]